MFLEDDAFLHSVVDDRKQTRVIIPHIQQADRFFVSADLRPGEHFEQFVEGAIASRTAILKSRFIGSKNDTLQLKFLHVSRGQRKQGLGTKLFRLAVEKAKSLGTRKLYISATPSENTVNFYMRLGCVLATEIDPELYVLELEDIHLEYPILKQ